MGKIWNACKEKAGKAKKRIGKFYNEHKTAVKASAAVIATAGLGFIGYKVMKASKEGSVENNLLNAGENVANDVAENCLSNEPTVEDWFHKNWKEDYRENWDKVQEFAKSLKLEDGEEYCITGPNTWEGQHDENIVSHLIYGDGAYPPDEPEED